MVCKLYLNKVITQNVLVQTVRSRPSMQETRIQSLGWEEPLEKKKATHSSILAWKIPWTGIVLGVAKSRTRLSNFHSITDSRCCIAETNTTL